MNAEIEPHILKMFEIKKRIGKGAYGIVWKALNKKTKEIIALKKIFDAFRNQTDAQRTFREIAFLQNFGNHPNIVRLYNVIRASSDKDIYLVFEFMETDLHNVIKKGNILNDVHKQYIMYQLLKATAYLHSGEVIHRDQKPSNVLLDSYCLVKLCDFGLARSLKGRSKCENGSGKINCKTLLPALTEYVATRWYRAPEILLACHDYTKGVDIWSLGCILGEMLIGTPLFPGSSTLDQIERIMGGLPKPSPEDLASVKSPYSSSILQKARIRNRRSLEQLLQNVDKTAIDLLYKMLHFNPHKRITALEALKHPYVRRFYCPNEIMIMNHHVTPPLDDNVQLTVSEYRDRLYQMISSKKTTSTTTVATAKTIVTVQNGINKPHSIKKKHITTGIPQPLTDSTCPHGKKQQSTMNHHQTTATTIKQQDYHQDPLGAPSSQQEQLPDQQTRPQVHFDDNNKNKNMNSSQKNHVVCVQVNLLHNHPVSDDGKLTSSPSKSPKMLLANDKTVNNSKNITTYVDCNITTTTNNNNSISSSSCSQLHNNHHDTDYEYNNTVIDVLHRSTSSLLSMPSTLSTSTGSATAATLTTAAAANVAFSPEQTSQLKQQPYCRIQSTSQNSMINSNKPVVVHPSPMIRSNSVNKMPNSEYQTSRRYSTVTPSYYPPQLLSKSNVVYEPIEMINAQLQHNRLFNRNHSHRSSSSNSTTTTTTTTHHCNYNRPPSYQSSLNSGSNSRVTTSNYYYFSAVGADKKYALLPNSFDNVMVTTTSQRLSDFDQSERRCENRYVSSQPENLSLNQEYEYLHGINDKYENSANHSNHSSHSFLYNEKYCSTSNIHENLFKDNHKTDTNLTENTTPYEYENKISAFSSSNIELPSKCVQQSTINRSKDDDIKGTITECTLLHKPMHKTTRDHSYNGNRNQKDSMSNQLNSINQTTKELDYESPFNINQPHTNDYSNFQQNRRNSSQSNYESLSSMNIQQKLKIIQGSTDIQNSMFQSKISTSLNNLRAKFHDNQSQSQSQLLTQQQGQSYHHRHQSDHNVSKYNRTTNQLSNNNSNNCYSYQKTKRDEKTLDVYTTSQIPRPNITTIKKPLIVMNSSKITDLIDQYQNIHFPKSNYSHQSIDSSSSNIISPPLKPSSNKHYSPSPMKIKFSPPIQHSISTTKTTTTTLNHDHVTSSKLNSTNGICTNEARIPFNTVAQHSSSNVSLVRIMKNHQNLNDKHLPIITKSSYSKKKFTL
ncbi:unnamed protein product [Schistosoma turkestanicum]|nr:unnamed protein product [Schistosoma turkestanicum]